jgi:hypothetical protein
MAAHVLPFEAFAMTSGAHLFFDLDITRRLLVALRARSFSPADLATLQPHDRTQLALNLIGVARGRPEMVRSMLSTSEAGRGFLPWASPARMLSEARAPRTGRNDPCHCGSGKKFKKCCAGKPAPSAS